MKKDPELPIWTRVIPVVGLVLGGLYVSWALFQGGPTPEEQQRIDEAAQHVNEPLKTLNTLDAQILQQIYGTNAVVLVSTTAASGATSVPVATSVATSTSSVATTTTSVGTKVSLPTLTGASVLIDANALGTARAATVALFTGDFSKVSVSSSALIPTLPTKWPDPSVGEPVVAGAGDEGIAINFLVDPDRDGPEAQRVITSKVVFESGVWVWAGA